MWQQVQRIKSTWWLEGRVRVCVRNVWDTDSSRVRCGYCEGKPDGSGSLEGSVLGKFPCAQRIIKQWWAGKHSKRKCAIDSREVWRTRKLCGAIIECAPHLWLTGPAWRLISEVFEEDGWQVKVIDGSLAWLVSRMLRDMVNICFGLNIHAPSSIYMWWCVKVGPLGGDCVQVKAW